MFYAFLGAIFIFKNTLQSMSKPLYPVISGVVELGIRSFSAIILASHIGYKGIYYASPLAWVGGAIIVFIGYYQATYKVSQKDLKKQYKKIEPYLPKPRGNFVVEHLKVLNAILYVAENGCKRRALPRRYERWNTVYRRFRRWAESGVLSRFLEALQK